MSDREVNNPDPATSTRRLAGADTSAVFTPITAGLVVAGAGLALSASVFSNATPQDEALRLGPTALRQPQRPAGLPAAAVAVAARDPQRALPNHGTTISPWTQARQRKSDPAIVTERPDVVPADAVGLDQGSDRSADVTINSSGARIVTAKRSIGPKQPSKPLPISDSVPASQDGDHASFTDRPYVPIRWGSPVARDGIRPDEAFLPSGTDSPLDEPVQPDRGTLGDPAEAPTASISVDPGFDQAEPVNGASSDVQKIGAANGSGARPLADVELSATPKQWHRHGVTQQSRTISFANGLTGTARVTRFAASVGGRSANNELYIQLASLLDSLRSKMPPHVYHRLRNAPAAQVLLTVEQLRIAGIQLILHAA